MTSRPRLVRSIPFWGLVVASLATAAAGAVILVDRLGVMTTTLTDGTATGVEVYVGQSLAGLGATLLGVGIVGILIALAVAAVATLRPHPPVEVVEPIDWAAESAPEDATAEQVEAVEASETTATPEPAAEELSTTR